MQAIIIAGGKGTRVRSVSTKVPKILFPLNKALLLDYDIRYLRENHFDDIIVCCGYLGYKIEKYIEKKDFSIPIRISKEVKPLGTAGPLHLIKNFLEDEFLVLFGDIYAKIDLKKMYFFHKKKNADITLTLHMSDHPEDSMVVKIDKKNKIQKFIKPGGNWRKYGKLTKSSLYIMKKSLLKFIPKEKKVDFDEIFPEMQRCGKKLFGYVTDEYIKDIGTPKRYKEVQDYLKTSS